MPTIHITLHSGEQFQMNAGDNLLDAFHKNQLRIPAPCGKMGTCGKCKFRLLKGVLPQSPGDLGHFKQEDLEDGWRLACSAYPKSDITIDCTYTEEANFAVLDHFTGSTDKPEPVPILPFTLTDREESFAAQVKKQIPQFEPSGKLLSQLSQLVEENASDGFLAGDGAGFTAVSSHKKAYYGVAIDIGTTTIGLAMVSLDNGQIVSRISAVNEQRRFGADVISRILSANKGNLNALSQTIRMQLSKLTEQALIQSGTDPDQIARFAITGNTTMLHLLLGITVRTLGAVPFTPITLDFLSIPYPEILTGHIQCSVDILPGISTYVGSDITAGILFTKLHHREKPALLLDIGTNGEMAVCNNGKIYCTSTAAGPAFEGANIECGIGSIPGAISSVTYTGDTFQIQTIDGQPPLGICGSGIIDTVWQCLTHNIIAACGRFDAAYKQKKALLAKTPEGQEIYFSQKDVRQVQLGKSAIRSGINILLGQAGLSFTDLEKIYIAGGFGYHINHESAAGIGMIPLEVKDRIIPAGNTSLGGTVSYILTPSIKPELLKIASQAQVYNLSEDRNFEQQFLDNLNF